jgi:hypothetical protein
LDFEKEKHNTKKHKRKKKLGQPIHHGDMELVAFSFSSRKALNNGGERRQWRRFEASASREKERTGE